MEIKDKTEEVKEDKTEEVKEDKTEEVKEDKTEEVKDLPQLVASIRAEYDSKIATLTAKYEKDIADRDAIITQILSNNAPAQRSASVIEQINEKRNYKKW